MIPVQSRATSHEPVLCLVAPAYNESQNITQFIEEWYPVVEKHKGEGLSRLVVIDDGSKDNTCAILQELSDTHPLLLPITKPNGGHGSAILSGYRYALEHKADYIFQTDTDGQTLPAEFEAFWALRNDYDAVLGKRPDRQDGIMRKFVERVLCLMLRIIFGVNVPDANAPFRLMRASLLQKYITKLPRDFNLANVMLTTYFAYFHENIAFRDITFRPRQGGKNSIHLKRITAIGLKAIKDFLRLRKEIGND
ncbi:MAG: glycosyltransferase family 2 protein [Synergistaceae bacterium]|nr:glycosyltransferase family 2 protein [Synergistaceae bacterium]